MTSVLAQVLAAGAPGASHLVGVGGDPSRYALRHAVKVGTAGSRTRWLVWLGDACPPQPPSHQRFGYLDGSGGVIVSTVDSALWLRVAPGPDGAVQVTGADGPAWREVQLHDGTPVPDRELRLAGLAAYPHHRQVLPGGERLVLLVRGA